MRGCNHVHKSVAIFLLTMLVSVLTSCASSNVSRHTASDVDMGVDNAKKLGSSFSHGDMIESYQNSSQRAKGALLGGAGGAIAAATTSSLGLIPGALAGMILGASYGAYIDSQATVADQLTNRGATIVELGDQLLVAIPSARLFDGMTNTIKPQAYSTLSLLATYINEQTKMLVKVSSYTDDIGEKSVNLALSKKQANSVAKYLTASGVNARVLYAEGYGGTNLVIKNISDWGKSDNYRIEVTMEKLEG